ncbi:hypothetical protein [Seonamhaeicola sp. S2-3]|uniref:hypothetical protein n=1 Tax=Seonamhaeicola sp. S2-3 TaxID=1936081 RepID=UPI0018DDC623|nr:hypothetical protein [Seonamhaeicola sp. S2-3]
MVFNSCSDKQEFEDIYYNGVKPNFSKSDIELGNLFAESLSKTTKKIKKDNIDLKNYSTVQKLSSEATSEVIGKRYAIPKEEMLMLEEKNVSFKQNNKKANQQTLTTMQQRALNAIEHARTHSKSALAFMDKLAAINQRVDELVPEGERQVLHQMIAINYYGIKEMNKLVRTGYLPGKAEYRPKKIKTGTTMAFNNTSLLDLTKMAHADGEVEVLPEVVIIVPSSNIGDGISWSDWYQLQDAYGNGYRDGYGDGSDTDYASEDDEESWWSSWGKCTAATLGGAGTGALAGWFLPAATCTVVIPGIGTVACGAVGAIVGGISGALTALGTADAC